MRKKQVTLRIGRKGEMHEKIYDVSGIVQSRSGYSAWAETREEVQNRLENAALVLHQIMAAPDKAFRKKCWIMQSALP